MIARSVALALVGVVLSLRALAYASPPDDTSVAGFWDDGDYDDVVLLLVSTPGAGETLVVYSIEPLWPHVSRLARSNDAAVSAAPLPLENPRGPPAVLNR